MATQAVSAVDTYDWIEMSTRSHCITVRAVSFFVNVESVFLIWLETADRACNQHGVTHLFEGNNSSDGVTIRGLQNSNR
jgi:hypothetical protein